MKIDLLWEPQVAIVGTAVSAALAALLRCLLRVSDLHEQSELLVFLLSALDELQSRRLVAAERSHSSLYLLFFLTAELKSTHKQTAHSHFSNTPVRTFDQGFIILIFGIYFMN